MLDEKLDYFNIILVSIGNDIIKYSIIDSFIIQDFFANFFRVLGVKILLFKSEGYDSYCCNGNYGLSLSNLLTKQKGELLLGIKRLNEQQICSENL